MKHYLLILLIGLCAMSIQAQEVADTNGNYGIFVDNRDGKSYKTVKIGNQVWMAENLNYDAEIDGYFYEYHASNGITYGRLYNWKTAKKVCPAGWHLPSDTEWKELEMYLGMSKSEVDNTRRGADVGGKLKEAGTAHWTHWGRSNSGATNESGFTALPGGYRHAFGTFANMGYMGCFWSSTEDNYGNARFRKLTFGYENISRAWSNKRNCYSVRCIKDE